MKEQFDKYFPGREKSASVISCTMLLESADGESVVFPPTYAAAKDGATQCPYIIDELRDGTNVCVLDSVGSQANRMERVFLGSPYHRLIPQVVIQVGEQKVNILQAGHRAADALVRYSAPLGEMVRDAFRAAGKGDLVPLAKIAPTSLVFGVWDSRDSQLKFPRIVSSIIRATDVSQLLRSAQYDPPVDYGQTCELYEGLTPTQSKAVRDIGLGQVPSTHNPGGVHVGGRITRTTSVQIAAMRHIVGSCPEETLKLRRYILGLSLVAATAPTELYLRQGCNLCERQANGTDWVVRTTDGGREGLVLSASCKHEHALEYARAAAADFGVGSLQDVSATFDKAAALRAAKSKKKGDK